MYLNHPAKALYILNAENVEGDVITNSKNVQNSYDVETSEDVKDSWQIEHAKDILDCDFVYYGEKSYCTVSNSKSSDILFCYGTWTNNYGLLYCMLCVNGSKNSFGSAGLKGQQYCILNKPYAREEYEALMPKIIEAMRATGEWGEYLDPRLSYHGYNETAADEAYPVTKEEVLAQGFKWSDYVPPSPQVSKVVKASQIPDAIDQVPDEILDWAIECEVSGRLFRVIKQELMFLREHGLPLPKRHPDIRHADRVALRNPQKLFDRRCDNCKKPIQSSYAPERPEIVYCEECYLKEVY